MAYWPAKAASTMALARLALSLDATPLTPFAAMFVEDRIAIARIMTSTANLHVSVRRTSSTLVSWIGVDSGWFRGSDKGPSAAADYGGSL